MSSPDVTYELQRDIPYRDHETDAYAVERCRLDVYHPVDRPGFTTVVWFHGGGMIEGEKSIPPELMDRGFAVVGAGYRLSPHVKSPTYIEDAAAAIAWVMRRIADYGGDPKRVYLTGHSAGAYLLSMAVLDKSWLAKHGVDADHVAAWVPLSAQCITHTAVREERGIGVERVIVDELAPLHHARADCPPVTLVTGDRELELRGRYEENAYMARMLKLAGHTRTQLIEVQGADHNGMLMTGFDILLRVLDGSLQSEP